MRGEASVDTPTSVPESGRRYIWAIVTKHDGRLLHARFLDSTTRRLPASQKKRGVPHLLTLREAGYSVLLAFWSQ